jgi:hypothetical protein
MNKKDKRNCSIVRNENISIGIVVLLYNSQKVSDGHPSETLL